MATKTKILVLEDDQFHRSVLAEGLIDYYHFDADQAETLEVAKSHLNSNKYDLLVFDCVLGGDDTSVLQWARELRQTPKWSGTPILFVTAYMSEMKEQVRHIARSSILSKPFTFDEFVQKARELLSVKA